MRHGRSVKQLGRTHAHRKAMFSNMVTSLFMEERIVTTREKGKELKRISEKLITRAKSNLDLPDDEKGKKLHNKRMVMRVVKDRDAVKKLFDDIAARFKGRNGGYTRLYLLGNRAGDAAEMAMVELVERKVEPAKTTQGKEKESLKKRISQKKRARKRKKRKRR